MNRKGLSLNASTKVLSTGRLKLSLISTGIFLPKGKSLVYCKNGNGSKLLAIGAEKRGEKTDEGHATALEAGENVGGQCASKWGRDSGHVKGPH